MSDAGRAGSTIWTGVAAIGGLLSGIAAVVALFVARPDTLRLILPVQVLEEVAAAHPGTAPSQNANAELSAPTADGAGVATEVEHSPEAISPPAVIDSQDLGSGVTLSLVSLTDAGTNYFATFRVENGGSADVGVAAFYNGRSNVFISDGLGGSCRMEAENGTSFPRFNPQYQGTSSAFQMLPSGGGAQYVGVFEKQFCDLRPEPNAEMTMNGSFVVFVEGEVLTVSVRFEHIAVRRR